MAILCSFGQNGCAMYDDVNGRKIPGLEQFSGLVDVEEPFPLTASEQYALTEATAELATTPNPTGACVALQAQYILNTFGKFPGTVPFFKPGAYLRTHADQMDRRHG